jgi:hypothetical protein
MKPTRKFKRGDRVICPNISLDTPSGVIGTIKRYDKYNPTPTVVIKRDDGQGWTDGKGIGWNIREDALELLSDNIGYEMD